MRRTAVVPTALVASAVAFGAVLNYRAWALAPPQLNDSVLHMRLAAYAAEHWNALWPVDYWFPSIAAGFPVFGHYPHLSHLAAAALTHLLGGGDAGRTYMTLSYCVLALLPLSIFVSLRRLGLSSTAAAAAATLYTVLTSNGYDGIGWESYAWGGHGLMAQLWGTLLVFPALGWGYAAVRDGRCASAGLCLGACTLAHFLFGYIAALSLALLLFLPIPGTSWRVRLSRLARIGAVTAAVTAYFVVPFAMNIDQVIKSRWEPLWKWDSRGAEWVLSHLLRGELFDRPLFPVISLLSAAGVLLALLRAVRGRDPLARWLLACLALWIALFSGRASLGAIANLLPFGSGLHMHRFIAGVQIFGLILAGTALGAAIDALLNARRSPVAIAAATAALLLAVFAAPIAFRIESVRRNNLWAKEALDASQQAPEIREVVEDLRRLPPGRVHAGFPGTWGNELRFGQIPMYTHLQTAGFDMVGYLLMAMSRTGDWQATLDTRRQDHCDLFDIRYLVAPENRPMPPFASLRARHGRLALYEVPTSGYFALGIVEPPPRNAFPGGSIQSADWEQVYELGEQWMRGAGPANHRYVALRDIDPPPADADAAGTLAGEEIAPGSYRCRAVLDRPASLVLKVTYHPYWTATVDGVAAAITPVIPNFMAIHLSAGEHQVAFAYQPPLWKKVLFGFAVAVAVAILLGSAARRVRRWLGAELPRQTPTR